LSVESRDKAAECTAPRTRNPRPGDLRQSCTDTFSMRGFYSNELRGSLERKHEGTAARFC
jgi:hypothetical protein